MIITEKITVGNRSCIYTYSNAGMLIERDGVRYENAIDPAELDRQYTETDEPIENGVDPNEATEYDYLAALERFGVK